MASELLDVSDGLGPMFASIGILISTTALAYHEINSNRDWDKNPQSRLLLVLLLVSLFNSLYIAWRDRELFKTEVKTKKTKYQVTYLIVVSAMIIVALDPT